MVKRYGDGWCYRFNYRDAYGTLYKPFKSGFKTRREAEDGELWAKTHIEEVIAEIRAKRGEKIVNIAVATDGKITAQISFEDFFPVYMKACREERQSIVTLEKKEYQFERIKTILPEFLKMQMGKINEDHIQPIINACSTPCVIHDMYKFLHAVFEFAIKKPLKRILRENPVEFVNKVEYVPKKKQHRDLEFANLLLSTLKRENSKFYTPVLLALTGGITREEAPAILESDMNFNDHTIQINKALVKSKSEGYVVKEQKTQNRERIYYGNFSIFNELHYFKRRNKIISEYLCCNENGSMMKIKTLDSGFRKFIKDHNLPHCTFHQLRTVLSDGQNQLGFDIYTSADTLGHGDIRVTAKHYRTHNPDAVRKATVEVFKAIT